MLKAYDGIDFRKIKNINDSWFFEPFSYFGINVHPYEVIFAKISWFYLQTGHNIDIIDKFTNWTYQSQLPPELTPPKFDWITYVLNNPDIYNAGILTEEKAKNHYNQYGKHEQRKITPDMVITRYLKINVENNNDNINNGILIGHYTGRFVVIPDIPNTEHLNCLINKHCLKTRIYLSIQHDGWKNVKISNEMMKTLYLLKTDNAQYLEINEIPKDEIFNKFL